jgi:rhamnosyltransferase
MILVVILYFPTIDELENIRKLSLCHRIVCIDNSVNKITFDEKNIDYFWSGGNVGIAKALNKVHRLIKDEVGYLFLDQDTKINSDGVQAIQCILSNISKLELSGYALINFKNGSDPKVRSADLVINSGSYFIVENIKKIGYFDERFFVDCVDYDICVRSHVAGLKVGVCSGISNLDHESGQADSLYTFMGAKIKTRRYSRSRFVGSLFGYIRIILYTIKNMRFGLTYIISRSLVIYVFGQIISWVGKKSVGPES